MNLQKSSVDKVETTQIQSEERSQDSDLSKSEIDVSVKVPQTLETVIGDETSEKLNKPEENFENIDRKSTNSGDSLKPTPLESDSKVEDVANSILSNPKSSQEDESKTVKKDEEKVDDKAKSNVESSDVKADFIKPVQLIKSSSNPVEEGEKESDDDDDDGKLSSSPLESIVEKEKDLVADVPKQHHSESSNKELVDQLQSVNSESQIQEEKTAVQQEEKIEEMPPLSSGDNKSESTGIILESKEGSNQVVNKLVNVCPKETEGEKSIVSTETDFFGINFKRIEVGVYISINYYSNRS